MYDFKGLKEKGVPIPDFIDTDICDVISEILTHIKWLLENKQDYLKLAKRIEKKNERIEAFILTGDRDMNESNSLNPHLPIESGPVVKAIIDRALAMDTEVKSDYYRLCMYATELLNNNKHTPEI